MRPARDSRYVVPTREDVIARLELLLAGEVPRSEIADWATEFILYDDDQIYPPVSDAVVFDALKKLSGADLPSTDREFLHDENDFAAWLAELRTS